jgi:hypothetical protein
MFNVTGVLAVAAAFVAEVPLELAELLLPHAARDRAPSPTAPARSASRRVIMLSVISLSSIGYCILK